MYTGEIGEGEESVRAAQLALALEPKLGEIDVVQHAELLQVYADGIGALGRTRDAVRILDSAIGLLDRSGRGEQVARMIYQHDKAVRLVELGETDRAERDLHETLRRAMANDPSGRVHSQPLIHYAEVALQQSHADSALKYFGMLYSQGLRDGSRYWRGRSLFGLARAQLRLGMVGEARKTMAEFRQVAADFPELRRTDDHLPVTTSLEGHLALTLGDTVSAYRRFLAALRENGYYDGKRKKQLRAVALLVGETALAIGMPDTALRYAREAAATSAIDSLTETRSARVGEARLIEARALLAMGDTANARELLARALGALQNGAGDDDPRTRRAAELTTRLARAAAE
jgi:tetratricopeptide (TPR) repeat protein